MATYPAIVHKEEGSVFGVSWPDFPGCTTVGDDIADAHAMAEEALQFHIEGMLEDGDPIPAPSPVAAVAAEAHADGAALMLVRVRLPGRAKRLNITIDEHLLAELLALRLLDHGLPAIAPQRA